MLVFAFVDRFLDIIGLGTVLYWCYRGTKRITLWRSERNTRG